MIPILEKSCKVNKSKMDLEVLYKKTFPSVARFISRSGGSFEEAKDIFHDALVVLIEKKTEHLDLAIQSEKSYVLGIAKHLWYRKKRQYLREIPMEEEVNWMEIPEDQEISNQDHRLLKFLKKAGKHCMDLLHAFYYRQLSIDEIAEDYGYSTKHSASVQKYKCLQKVRNIVKLKSLSYDDFTQ